MSCGCMGNKHRQELRKKLNDVRDIPGEEIDSSKKISVDLGAGQVVKLDVQELAERERKSTEWKTVAAGNVRVIPVTEFRLYNLPKQNENGEVNFEQKDQNLNVIDGYSMQETDDKIEKELREQFNELKSQGKCNKVAS